MYHSWAVSRCCAVLQCTQPPVLEVQASRPAGLQGSTAASSSSTHHKCVLEFLHIADKEGLAIDCTQQQQQQQSGDSGSSSSTLSALVLTYCFCCVEAVCMACHNQVVSDDCSNASLCATHPSGPVVVLCSQAQCRQVSDSAHADRGLCCYYLLLLLWTVHHPAINITWGIELSTTTDLWTPPVDPKFLAPL